MSRVCICSAAIGACPPFEAGAALGRAFVAARPGRDQVAVVPLSVGGAELPGVLAALGYEADVLAHSDARGLGIGLAEALSAGRRVIVDLTVLDAGPTVIAELASALGLDTGPAARRPNGPRPAGAELIAVLPAAEASDRLLGVEGLTARRGYAAGESVASVVTADAELARLAAAWGVPDAPGLGAAGGAPLVLAALGARLLTGIGLCREASGLDATLGRADVVVVGVDAVHTGNFGGPVLLDLAPVAAELGVPVIAIAREVSIAPRELRRHGVEGAYQLGVAVDADAAAITSASARAARTWLG